VCSLIAVVIGGGCFGGSGSGLIGICCGESGGTNGTRPVLGFFVQPNTTDVGETISPPVQVVVRDTLGGIDSAFIGTITVTLGSNSTGATLSGTTAVRPVNGISSFGNLAVDIAGTYTLQASATDAATVTSNSFSVTSPTTP
jgi:hypothetical protein